MYNYKLDGFCVDSTGPYRVGTPQSVRLTAFDFNHRAARFRQESAIILPLRVTAKACRIDRFELAD